MLVRLRKQEGNVVHVHSAEFVARGWDDKTLENFLWFCLNFYEGIPPDAFYLSVIKEAKRRGKL